MWHNSAQLIFCATVMAASGVLAQGATVAHWQFDEKAPGGQADVSTGILDSSGNSHDGLAVGVPLPYYVASWDSSSAIELNNYGGGTHDDRIVVPLGMSDGETLGPAPTS